MYTEVETLIKMLRNYHQLKVLFTFAEYIYCAVFSNMLLFHAARPQTAWLVAGGLRKIQTHFIATPTSTWGAIYVRFLK